MSDVPSACVTHLSPDQSLGTCSKLTCGCTAAVPDSIGLEPLSGEANPWFAEIHQVGEATENADSHKL